MSTMPPENIIDSRCTVEIIFSAGEGGECGGHPGNAITCSI